MSEVDRNLKSPADSTSKNKIEQPTSVLGAAPEDSLAQIKGTQASVRTATEGLVQNGTLPDTQIANERSKPENVRGVGRVASGFSPDRPADAKPITNDLAIEGVNLVPGKPTIAVLDKYHEKAPSATGDLNVGHGELNARAATESGYGVIRLDSKSGDPKKALGDIVAAIDSGALPLKKGDFINMSIGQNGTEIANLGKLVDLKDKDGKLVQLTEDNLRLYKNEVAKKLDPFHFEVIQKLRERGIKVLGAEVETTGSGYVGPANVDPDYLGTKALRAKSGDGAIAPYSGGYKDLSNTGLGDYDVQFVTDKNGKSEYRLAGKGQIFAHITQEESGRPQPLPGESYRSFPYVRNADGSGELIKEKAPVVVDEKTGETIQTIDKIHGTSYAHWDYFRNIVGRPRWRPGIKRF